MSCSFNTKNLFVFFCVLFGLVDRVNATTYHSIASGNWASNTTWSLTQGGGAVGPGVFPGSSDIVYIYAGFTVTIGADASCASLQLGATPTTGGTGAGSLTYGGSFQLTVSGNIALGGSGNAGNSGTLTFPSGSIINAGSLTLGNAGSTPAPGIITMTAGGTMNLNGTIAVNTVAGNTWTPGSGSVVISGSNTLPSSIFTSFNNLTISSGTTTLAVSLNSTAAGTLTVKAGATFALSSFNYGATTAPASVTVECGATVASSISGTGSLSLGGNLTVNTVGTGSNGASISSKITLTGNRTLTVADDGTTATDLTIGGIISGGFGITKAGTGKLTLSGTNTYTGITTINAGIHSVATIGNGGVAGNLGQATNAAANLVLGGGTLQYTGSNASTDRNFTLTTATTSTFDITNTLTISGASTSTTGALIKIGSGTLKFSGANLYSGLTTITAGTLQEGVANALAAGGVTVNDGGTFDLNGFSDVIGALIVNSGTVGGTVTTGVGTLTPGSVTSTGGATNASISGNLALTATRTFTLTNAADGLSVSAIISGGFGITKAGNGKLTLTGTNTYTGITTINLGILSLATIGNGGVAGNMGQATNAAGNLVLGGGTLQYTGSIASTDRNFTLTTGTTSTFDITNTLTMSGASTSTTGALIKIGSGTLKFSGANLYSGLTTITAGTLQEGVANALAAGGVTVNDGGTFDLNGFSDVIGALIVNSGTVGGTVTTGVGTLTPGSVTSTGGATNASISGNLALTATRTFTLTNAADGLSVSAIISGGFGITKAGNGKLTLTGTNTYTGKTTINLGILSLATIGNGGVAGNMGQATNAAGNLVLGGGTLQYTGSIASTDRNFTLTAGTTSTFDITNTLTMSGASTSTTGALIKIGSGTLVFSGANLYSGLTTITAGTLQEGVANALAAGGVTVNDGGTFDLNGFSDVIGALIVNSGTVGGTVTTGAGTLTPVSVTSTGGASNASISGNLALTATRTFTITNAADGLSVSAIISGGFGITKAGNGKLTLTGTNTYTGITTINLGILSLATIGNGGVAGNMGQAANAAGNLVLGGGTLQYTGSNASTDRNFTLTAGTTSTFDITNTLTISGASTNTTGAVTKIGSGTLKFSGTNLYTGLTTITAGTVQEGIANAISSGPLTINGGTLDIQTFTDAVGLVTLSSGSIIGTSGVLTGTSYAVQSGTISAILAGAVALTKTTSGTVTMSGVNTYTGVTTISAGVLSVATIGNGGVAGNLGQASNAASNLLLDGGTLQYSGLTASTDRNFILTTGLTSTIDVTTNILTISGASTNTTGALTKIGSGTLILSGGNLYTGLTTITAGTLKLGANNALATGNVLLNGGQFDLATFTESIGVLTLTSGTISSSTGILTATSYAVESGTISAILAGSGALTKTTSGTVILSGVNTYTGVNTISAGILSVSTIGNGGVAGNLGKATNAAANLLLDGGTLQYTGSTSSTDRNFILSTGLTSTIDITTNTLTISGAATSTTGALTKTGAGTLILSGANLFTGLTTVSAGTLQLGASNVLLTGPLTVNGGNLDMTSFSDAVGAVTLSNGTISGSSGVLTATSYDLQNGTVSAILGGSVSVTKSTSGKVTLSGTNTFTGAISVLSGTLNLQNNQASGTIAGGITVSSGADLEVEGGITVGNESLSIDGLGTSGNATFINVSGANSWGGAITIAGDAIINSTAGTFTITNTINLGANTLTIQGASTNANTIGGVISGSGLLKKSGVGTWVLTATNLNTGGVTLHNGKLVINNSQALGTLTGTFNIGGVGNAVVIDNTSGASITILNYPMAWNDDFTFTGSNALNLGTGTVSMSSDIIATISSNTLTVGGVISGSTFSLTKDGGGSLTLTGTNTFTGGATLNAGTLNINNLQALGTVAGTFTLAGGIIDNTSGADITTLNYPLALNGDFTYSGSVPRNLNLGTGNVTMSANRQITVSAGTLTIGGAISQSTLNLTKVGSGTLSFVSNAVTLNSVTISAGTLVSTSGTLTISGDYSNSGTFTHNSGSVTFNSASAQAIGGTASSTFNNLNLNGGGAKTLGKAETVNGTLAFNNGLLFTTATNLLTFAAGSIVGGSVSDNSFVDGPVKKTGNSAFVFPVGKSGTGYQAVAISAPLLATDEFTAEYKRISPLTISSAHVAPVTDISSCEYWQLDRTTGTSPADVTLYGNANSGCGANTGANYFTGLSSSLSDLLVLHFNGTIWESATGGATIVSGTYPNITVTATTERSFSPFTFGSKGHNPLPVKLISFTAVGIGNDVHLNWSTASELNNDFFSIERSTDGIHFIKIDEVDGAGNSFSILKYQYIDSQAMQTPSSYIYYRLKQTDFNNAFEYSSIATVNTTKKCSFIIAAIQPNPVADNFSISFSIANAGDVRAYLSDVEGRILMSQNSYVKKGMNAFNFNTSGYAEGLYFLTFSCNGVNETRKIILKR